MNSIIYQDEVIGALMQVYVFVIIYFHFSICNVTSISTVDGMKIDCNNAQEMLLDDHYIEALLHGDYDFAYNYNIIC